MLLKEQPLGAVPGIFSVIKPETLKRTCCETVIIYMWSVYVLYADFGQWIL